MCCLFIYLKKLNCTYCTVIVREEVQVVLPLLRHKFIYLFGCFEVDDASELFGIKRSTSDQTSINLRHGHEFVNTIGCDGTSVLDSCRLGDFVVVHASQDGSQKAVGLVCCILLKLKSN